MASKYRKFSPEFRDEAARMVIDTSRSIAEWPARSGSVKQHWEVGCGPAGIPRRRRARAGIAERPGCGNSSDATATSRWKTRFLKNLVVGGRLWSREKGALGCGWSAVEVRVSRGWLWRHRGRGGHCVVCLG